MSQHETIYFKKSDAEGNLRLCTLSIWNLNHFDMGFHHGLIFSSSSPFTPNLCQRTRRRRHWSSDSLWMSVRGRQTNKKLTQLTKKRCPDYFLNAMFLSINHSGDSPCHDCWWQQKKNTALECICILICHQLPLRCSFEEYIKESLIRRSSCFILYATSRLLKNIQPTEPDNIMWPVC